MNSSVNWDAWLRLSPPAPVAPPRHKGKAPGPPRTSLGERDARVMMANKQERDFFWSHVGKPTPEGCLIYRTNRQSGYAQFPVQGVRINVQRVAKLWQEPPPIWGVQTVRHLCPSRFCVNAEHLCYAKRHKWLPT